jgi:hypothetical protein
MVNVKMGDEYIGEALMYVKVPKEHYKPREMGGKYSNKFHCHK